MRFLGLRENHHRHRANQNHQFLQKLETSNINQYDWMGTVVFYIALHRVRAKLASKIGLTRKKIGHEDLNRYVVRNFGQNVATDYIFLYGESRRLRYDLRINEMINQATYNRYKDILLTSIFPATT